MDKKNMTEYIKVNLPLTEQDYLAGNGEGVWVLVDPKRSRPTIRMPQAEDMWESWIMTAAIIPA